MNGQEESEIHKNPDLLCDPNCVVTNQEHGAKKNGVLVCISDVNGDRLPCFRGSIEYRKDDT